MVTHVYLHLKVQPHIIYSFNFLECYCISLIKVGAFMFSEIVQLVAYLPMAWVAGVQF
jgi:hypothetical protein